MVPAPRFKTTRLPNGFEVAHASQTNFDILHRELFTEELYSRHGIEIRDGDCILDIGANIGFFVLYLEHLLSHATVYAFEPIPATFSLLHKNVQQCSRIMVHLLNCGLAATAGQASFRYSRRMDLASTMYPDDSSEFRNNSRRFILQEIKERGGWLGWLAEKLPESLWWPTTEILRIYYQQSEEVDCELRTVSQLVREQRLERIDLLKLDAEGAELDVLRGIEQEHWPLIRQLVVEVHQGKAGLQQLLDILEPHGFHIVAEQPNRDVEHLQMLYARR